LPNANQVTTRGDPTLDLEFGNQIDYLITRVVDLEDIFLQCCPAIDSFLFFFSFLVGRGKNGTADFILHILATCDSLHPADVCQNIVLPKEFASILIPSRETNRPHT
jgi:hypothetical protein